MGPFQYPPFPNTHVSPIGIIPKSSCGRRMITHLSYPPSQSINDFIDPEPCTVRYTSFDTVVEMIAKLGPDTELAKVDMKSTFRLIRVCPSDFHLLCYFFNGFYYIDKCLPFGCAISCSIFEKFATFVYRVTMNTSEFRTLDHYLDDFIFAGPKGTSRCQTLMTNFLSVCKEMGIPKASEKTVGPVTKLTFLGLEIDTREQLVRIPSEKIADLIKHIEKILNHNKSTLKIIMSLVGKLNVFSKAVRGSRAFNRRFYDATIGVSKQNHHIRITQSLREDLNVWLQFLNNFNGITYFPNKDWESSDTLSLFTDSAGCGCFFNGKWMFMQWPPHWESCDIIKDITFLELIPLVLAIEVWGKFLRNRRVYFNVDNEALVAILNKQSSKSKRVMSLLRPLVLALMNYNITFKARHIEGANNEIADSISRKQWDRFRKLAPNADQRPETVPTLFRDRIFSMK
ncbi:hypothetical protein FSP39_023831 [Pinctada imbricata]|uniref:Reverse transcriptase domain-containing protein n=1 Tax=Pinctada imbricata TaxID=66713 RepID=A0AA88YUD8_PINIB|nr:hypothetical protein FSP39_023831 [Pinctada imbricata]